MNDMVKIALIIAVAIVAAVWVYVYFSPYQTAMRACVGDGGYSEMDCTVILRGERK